MSVIELTALRALPSVDEVLRSPTGVRALERAPRWAVLRIVRQRLEEARAAIRQGDGAAQPFSLDDDSLDLAVEALLAPRLRPVINATGIVLHTNLGRAPLHEEALQRIATIARGYSNLEYDVVERKRGSRHDHVAQLLSDLCGSEAACVVNNNAAAVLLSLAALAQGREVIVSRGELVEIGGSFRIPDVMRLSGATLREVGTTNQTHLRDYRDAIGEQTAVLLKVHRSNFSIVGFVGEVSTDDLVALGRERNLPVMIDLGSGNLTDTDGSDSPLAFLAMESKPRDALAAGATLVTFSGDKLLGGPQAGLIVGRAEHVERVRRHPLMRALRPDKLSLAALEATLELYRDGRQVEVPVLAMLGASLKVLRSRAQRLARKVRAVAPGLDPTVVRVPSQVGGGALPTHAMDSYAVTLLALTHGANHLDARLRSANPPVISRTEDGRVVLDVRCIQDREIVDVVKAILSATL